MRVLVCGGRYYQNVPALWAALDRLDGVKCVIDGASDDLFPKQGADYWGHQWALARGVTTWRFHADWKQHGRKAGPVRNQRMIDEGKPDVCVAASGGWGTADMARRCNAAGIKVIEVPA